MYMIICIIELQFSVTYSIQTSNYEKTIYYRSIMYGRGLFGINISHITT